MSYGWETNFVLMFNITTSTGSFPDSFSFSNDRNILSSFLHLNFCVSRSSSFTRVSKCLQFF